jgi:hypothetical protein
MAATTLTQILAGASYHLGETSVPTSQNAIRTDFANDGKTNIRDLRNWTWELNTGTPVNLIANRNYYTLATDLKNTQAVNWLACTDSNGNLTYYSPVDEGKWNSNIANSDPQPVYVVRGNKVAGYTVYLSPTPTENVTGGLTYQYYWDEADFVNPTDTTRIPKAEVIIWHIVSMVLFGYREQSQYQLAVNEMNAAIEDMSMFDQKRAINDTTQISTFRQSLGASNNFKTYY